LRWLICSAGSGIVAGDAAAAQVGTVRGVRCLRHLDERTPQFRPWEPVLPSGIESAGPDGEQAAALLDTLRTRQATATGMAARFRI
jgi:hypothetical protein